MGWNRCQLGHRAGLQEDHTPKGGGKRLRTEIPHVGTSAGHIGPRLWLPTACRSLWWKGYRPRVRPKREPKGTKRSQTRKSNSEGHMPGSMLLTNASNWTSPNGSIPAAKCRRPMERRLPKTGKANNGWNGLLLHGQICEPRSQAQVKPFFRPLNHITVSLQEREP